LQSVQLGTVGLWIGSRVWRGAEQEIVGVSREVEQLGYRAIWLGGAPGDLALPRSILAATQSLTVATGILNVWLSSPLEVAMACAELHASYPGRFLLGLGTSHATHLQPLGLRYEKPYEKMLQYLDALDRATPPVAQQNRVMAALGPRYLRLAAQRSAGAHPYLVTPRHTANARELLGDSPLLAPEMRVVLDENPAEARTLARAGICGNLGLDNYRRSLMRQGYAAADLDADGTDQLVDDLVGWGSPSDIARKVSEHLASGANHVALQLITGDNQVPIRQWRRLAPAMADLK
jgi:probable F420-dependent oxidoreductase